MDSANTVSKTERPNLKIYFFSPFCLLRNTVNRIFDVRMCDAFAANVKEVTIVHPYTYMKDNLKRKKIIESYLISNRIYMRMQYTPLDEKTGKHIRGWMLLLSFTLSTLRIVIENAGNLKNTVIISRASLLLMPAIFLKKIFGNLMPLRTVLQIHEIKDSKASRWVYQNSSGLMPNTQTAKSVLIERENISQHKICVMNAPAFDYSKTDCSKQDARKKINFDLNIPLVVYTGKVGINVYELYYFIDTAKLLPQYHFLSVGGKKSIVDYFKNLCRERGINNITFIGFLSNALDVRYYQLAADVLVSYHTSRSHPVEFNYPQKIQEYISTKNPIVTPDHPATRDIINSGNAFFVQPDNPSSLAEGITEAMENKTLANQKANVAFEISKKITISNRADDFLNFISLLK